VRDGAAGAGGGIVGVPSGVGRRLTGSGTAAVDIGVAADCEISARISPTPTTSPSWCNRLTSVPPVVAGTSTVTLSVSSSTMVSPDATRSPSCFNHRETVASTMDSPSGGTLMGIMP
jgi:hypothetical protein